MVEVFQARSPRSWTRQKRAWSADLSKPVGLVLATPFLLAVLLFLLVPFGQLIITASGAPKGWGNFTEYFRTPTNLRVLRTTFVDSAIVTLVSVVLGAVIAWSLRTTERKSTKLLLLTSIFIPFWMGSVMKLYAFSILLGREGVVNRVLVSSGLIEQPLRLLYTQTAVVLGMVYQLLPYAVLPAYVAFLSVDLDLVKAAESLGASRIKALRSVALPLALPGLVATVVIVYVISVGFFLTPVLLGGAASPFTASLIYADIFTYYNVADAAVSGIWLLVGALGVIGVGLVCVGRERLMRALVQ
jgi:ABC-type spermidine/putrescine transport system permease subunit I